MKTRLRLIRWMTLSFALAFVFPLQAEEADTALRQGEAAIYLANRLGLGTQTLNEMTAVQLLMSNGITPFGGWQLDQPFSVEDLARVLVQIIGAMDEIPAGERDNPETTAYKDFLIRVRNLNLDRLAIAMAPAGALSRPADMDPGATDPLRGRGGEGESADDEGGVFVPVGFRLIETAVTRVVPSRGAGRRGRPDPEVSDTTPTEPQP